MSYLICGEGRLRSLFFFSSRRRHTRFDCDWSSDVCSSDLKFSAPIEQMNPSTLAAYAGLCGWTLARAHARSGDRIALAAYLGGSGKFDQAIADFAEKYADQNERDDAALQAAVKDGRAEATTDI